MKKRQVSQTHQGFIVVLALCIRRLLLHSADRIYFALNFSLSVFLGAGLLYAMAHQSIVILLLVICTCQIAMAGLSELERKEADKTVKDCERNSKRKFFHTPPPARPRGYSIASAFMLLDGLQKPRTENYVEFRQGVSKDVCVPCCRSFCRLAGSIGFACNEQPDDSSKFISCECGQ